MTYPDDVLKAAERVTALFRPVLTFREAERLRDDIAWEIMAERERCAEIAKTVMDVHERLYPSARDDGQRDRVGARFRTAKRIYLTILGPESKEVE